MNDSGIVIDRAFTAYNGPDAIELFRATAVCQAIRLLSRGIRPCRGMTMTKALAMASRYTGKHYKRGQTVQALADLRVWIETMKSALPVEDRRGPEAQ